MIVLMATPKWWTPEAWVQLPGLKTLHMIVHIEYLSVEFWEESLGGNRAARLEEMAFVVRNLEEKMQRTGFGARVSVQLECDTMSGYSGPLMGARRA